MTFYITSSEYDSESSYDKESSYDSGSSYDPDCDPKDDGGSYPTEPVPNDTYFAEFRSGDPNAYIVGSYKTVGQYLDYTGAGHDGVDDDIFLDGTNADQPNLYVSLGKYATDSQNLYIDPRDYEDHTKIKVDDTDLNDCVLISNVYSISGPGLTGTTTLDTLGGDTNGDEFGELTLDVNVMHDDDDDDGGSYHYGYDDDDAGHSAVYTIQYFDENGDMQTLYFEALDDVTLKIDFICFTRGTMIATGEGEKAVEDLQVGDLVRTRDNGVQPIRWIGSREVGVADFGAHPHIRPIRIRADALGAGMPSRDLSVSPQHRMLVSGAQVELMFGESEVLVPAKALLNDKTVTVDYEVDETEYFHIMFDDHEIVFANGAEAESFHADEFGLGTLTDEARAELFLLFPELEEKISRAHATPTARMVLRRYEGSAVADL